MGVTVSSLGVAAALSGGLFGAALQKPAVLLAIAGLMVALSLSCFGVYTLQAPAAVMRVAGASAGGALGAVFMGLTMGIVAAPCVGPIVIGLLTFVGARQDPLLGFGLFAALSAGLGAPYVVLALAARSLRSLPRSGEWLLWTEHLFGFVLLGLAVYFVQLLLPQTLRALALPALIAVAAVYLGFLDPAGGALRGFAPLKRGAGIAGLALALWMGWPEPSHGSIPWQPYTDQALSEARSEGRPVVIDVAAEWCIPCKEMEKTTFRHPEVQAEAEAFRMLRLDMTYEGDENDRLTEELLIRGVPTTVFLGPDGEEVERKVGYVSAAEMLEAMRRVKGG
jgi:thiol:disulfide interchange protein DsbD